MFRGLVEGKLQKKIVLNAFAIHLVILALRVAIIAAMKWPQLIVF